MRVFLYVQNLTGSGHLVRIGEIARALSERHEVWVTDGGRPVPRRPLPDRVGVVSLPRIRRDGPGLAALEASRKIDDVLNERRRLLLEAIERVRPDVLLIEHFPISKWNLRQEILPVIDAARAVNPGARVVSSLRDISPRHRYDAGAEEHRRRTRETLETHFDRLLVHADPHFVGIGEHIPWADEVGIPVDYTGFVSEKPVPGEQDADAGDRNAAGSVVVSAGGAGTTSLASRSIAAWRRLEARREDGGRTLFVFLPLKASTADTRLLRQEGAGLRACIEPFALDFLERVRRADLSLSHAGYNTCMNLLETRTRALIAPMPELADQLPRARRFAEKGLAQMLSQSDLEAEPLATAILAGLDQPKPRHDFDLNGARRTCEILESL